MIEYKILDYDILVNKISELCIKTNIQLTKNFTKIVSKYIKSNLIPENNKKMLNLLLENSCYAKKEKLPICQDTGICTYYIQIGNKIKFNKKSIYDAVQEGTALGYKNGFLRKSIVKNPITRKPNTNDNTPAFVYTNIVEGDKLKIWFLPKGGGSENVSAIKMFNPSTSFETIQDYLFDTMKNIGSKACPPYKLGICIGGTFDYCAMMSKKILINEFADKTKQSKLFSESLMQKMKKLKIGPQGIGGNPSVLKINIKMLPTHIAMLPVALSVSCNAVRIGKLVI